jgi:drug/metabolite transporter (DMT)-like permease
MDAHDECMSGPRRNELQATTATLAIAATGVAYGFTTFFARRLTEVGLAPATVAFSRFALVALVLAPSLWSRNLERRAITWGFASGAAMSVGWIAYVAGIEQGDVALAGVAYMTYPLFTLLSLAVCFGHRLGARQVLGGLAVVGAAALALRAGSSGGGLPLVTFAAPATFGFATAVLTERLTPLRPTERLATVATGASLALVPIVGRLPVDAVVPPDTGTWVEIIGLGVGAALIPMLVYSVAAPVVGAARSAVAGATELPTVLIIGGLLFGETLTGAHLAAAGLIGVAILVTPVTRSTHVLPDHDDVHVPGESSGSMASPAGPETTPL